MYTALIAEQRRRRCTLFTDLYKRAGLDRATSHTARQDSMFERNRIVVELTSASGHNRKSVTATRMSAFGGKAEVDFGRLEVCL